MLSFIRGTPFGKLTASSKMTKLDDVCKGKTHHEVEKIIEIHPCISCKIPLTESLKIITNVFDVFNILCSFFVISQKKIPQIVNLMIPSARNKNYFILILCAFQPYSLLKIGKYRFANLPKTCGWRETKTKPWICTTRGEATDFRASMEKRTPDFLTRLFRRIPQNSEFSEAKGWEDTADDTRFNGWDSSPGSSISGAKTNGWSDEPPEIDYNGWGSVSLPRSRTPEGTNNGWAYEKPKTEYNGWGSGSGSGGKGRSSADRSGGWKDELPEVKYNGWEAPESKPISQQAEIDVNSLPIAKPTPLNVESWAPPPLPSAPPIPDGGFSENPAANEGGNGGALCVVCWEAPVEGACVPCGHMASCMTCLHEIESRNGTCPICRSKIDKVIRIYAASLNQIKAMSWASCS